MYCYILTCYILVGSVRLSCLKDFYATKMKGTPTQFLMLQLHAVRKWEGILFFVATLTAQFLRIFCHSVAVTVNVICWAEGSKHMVFVSKQVDYPVVSANLSVDHEFPDSMAIYSLFPHHSKGVILSQWHLDGQRNIIFRQKIRFSWEADHGNGPTIRIYLSFIER